MNATTAYVSSTTLDSDVLSTLAHATQSVTPVTDQMPWTVIPVWKTQNSARPMNAHVA